MSGFFGDAAVSVRGARLTFGAAASAFGRTLYASAETFDLATGSRLDVDALLWMTGTTNAQGVWVGDGTKAIYNVREAAATSFTLGRYNGTADGSLSLTLTASPFPGLNRIGLTVAPAAAAMSAVASVEYSMLAGSAFGSTSHMINTAPARVYILADDIDRCEVRAKLTAL